MKALLLAAPGQLEIAAVAEPTMRFTSDLIVDVGAAGICGSDTHGYLANSPRRTPPLIMGHEACGTVRAVGPDVEGRKVGDRIFIMPMETCTKCEACLEGTPERCEHRQVYGADIPGAFADQIRIAARNAIELPESVSWVAGTLVEPLSVVIHGLSRSRLLPGAAVAVVGAGTIGLLAVATLSLYRPRHLIVVEPNLARRQIATALGATATIDPSSGDAADTAAEITEGSGVELVVEAAGVSATIGLAVDIAQNSGTIVWLGNSGGLVQIDGFQVVWKQLTLHASVGTSRRAVRRAIALIESEDVRVDKIVTAVLPLSDGVLGFERQATMLDIVKTVLVP